MASQPFGDVVCHVSGTKEEEANTQSDQELVVIALTDPKSFGPIIERYKDAVFSVSLARVRNFHDAEDVAQQVFVEAYQKLTDLKDPPRLGAWLRTIAITRSLNHLERGRRATDLDAIPDPVDDRPRPDERFEESEQRRRLFDAVGPLSKAQQETVALYYLGEYKIHEVAEMQGVPEGTIKHRLHEARKHLKQDIMTMVKDNLKSESLDESFADRVLDLLSDPVEGRAWRSTTASQFRVAGERGQDGFARAMAFPNWRTRMRAIHYLGSFHKWGLDESFVADLLLQGLKDPNRRVRINAINILSQLNRRNIVSRSFVPNLVPMLKDPSRCVRMRAVSCLTLHAGQVPLNTAIAAMIEETDDRTLKRFQSLIRQIVVEQGVELE